MAEKQARAPMEIPDMPASFEKEYMQAVSESGPTTALLDKYDAASPRDLPAKIIKAAEKAMNKEKTVKKSYGGMPAKRKVLTKNKGGMVKANCGASMKATQKGTPKGN